MKHLLAATFLCLLYGVSLANAATSSNDWLTQAVNSPLRTAEEKARDINRRPVETLQFFGLQPNMRVVELMPGGGWYSKILSAALADSGELYISFGTDRVPEELSFSATGTMAGRTKLPGAGYIYDIEEVDIGVKDADLVLTFRNMHNFSASGRAKLNQAAFEALKPGGIYGVIDHSKRHMEAFGDWTWRRLDPVLVIKEAQQAGFVFEDFADLHARPEDELKYDTRHDSLVNESDRFTLKFRKPR